MILVPDSDSRPLGDHLEEAWSPAARAAAAAGRRAKGKGTPVKKLAARMKFFSSGGRRSPSISERIRRKNQGH